MRSIDAEAYERLKENSKIWESSSHGEKVICLESGLILKMHRIKRLFTSAWFRSYSKRFQINALKLKKRKVLTVEVIDCFKIPFLKRTAVLYRPIPGLDIRAIAKKENGFSDERIRQLAKFLYELHEKGIYFRAIHLGNLIITPDDEIGLIDIADMRFSSSPLLISTRVRNFHHIFRYKDDYQLLKIGESKVFINAYLSNMPAHKIPKLIRAFEKMTSLLRYKSTKGENYY